MNEAGDNISSNENLKDSISESVQQDKDIRSRVRDATLRALNSRSLDTKEMKSIIKSVTEGINLGLSKRAGEIKTALSEAMAGLDEALMKSAEATHLALRQLTSQGKDFTDHELKDALENLKSLEKEFLSVVSQVAQGASSKIKQEMNGLGPTFVKLGQVLATRVDIFPPNWIAEFEKLQSEVAPVPFDELLPSIDKALGTPPSEIRPGSTVRPRVSDARASNAICTACYY